MFQLAIDRNRRVLWVSCPGNFTREDLAAMDESSNIVIEAAKPIDCVYDFSESVGSGNLFRDDFLERGQQPHAIAEMRRIVIASSPGILNLAQIFAAAQALIGSNAPAIVRSPQEARHVLGHAVLDLEPTDLESLREMLRAERG